MVESDLVYYWLGTTSVNLVLLACLLFGWLCWSYSKLQLDIRDHH